MLMSGESTLDEDGLSVRHLLETPITYVTEQVGAGHAALSFTRMLPRPETPLTQAEIQEFRAISAVTFGHGFNQSLAGVR